MWKLIQEVEKLMENYPYHSQSKKRVAEIMIPVKLFELSGSIKWWLSEYDPIHKVAFWYVTGFVEDEWGTVSLEELESLEITVEINGIKKSETIPRVELDKFHQPIKFSDLPIKSKYDFL